MAAGYRPGIVSRGHGGRTHYPFDVKLNSDPSATGDEALMLLRRTGCPVVVDPDRVSAAKYLLQQHDCDVIVADDGLQCYGRPTGFG